MGTKITAEIPDEVHRELAHHRIDESETNNVVVTKALAEFFGMEIKNEWFEDEISRDE